MVCDDTLKWVEDGKADCDEDGVPMCVQMMSVGVYSFKVLKDKYN